MISFDRTIERATELVTQKGWNPYRLAKKSGLSPNALSKLGTPDFSPTLKTLRKIARALDAIATESEKSSEADHAA